MARYLSLLRIEVGHGFYAGGRCRDLRWVPTADTAAVLRASGAVVREDDGALVLYGTAQALAASAPAVLAWQLHALDDDFATATDDPAQRPGELLYFDAADAVAETAGHWRLHAGATVSSADVRPVTWPLVAQALLSRPGRLPPLALLRVPLARLPPPPVALRLQLAARATVWKYCLHGDWPEPQLQVVDPAQQAVFGAPEPDRLVNGAPLLAIRSEAPIALAQRSGRRFQLRSRQRGGDKVLVPCLPVAAARFLAREQIGGTSRLVSEIHVHR